MANWYDNKNLAELGGYMASLLSQEEILRAASVATNEETFQGALFDILKEKMINQDAKKTPKAEVKKTPKKSDGRSMEELMASVRAGNYRVKMPEDPEELEWLQMITYAVFVLTQYRCATHEGSGSTWEITKLPFNPYLAQLVVSIYRSRGPVTGQALDAAADQMARLMTSNPRLKKLVHKPTVGEALAELVFGGGVTFEGLAISIVEEDDSLIHVVQRLFLKNALDTVAAQAKTCTSDAVLLKEIAQRMMAMPLAQ